MRNFLILAILAGIVVLGFQIHSYLRPQSIESAFELAEKKSANPEKHDVSAEPASASYQEITERPLFDKTRRPAQPEAATAPQAPAPVTNTALPALDHYVVTAIVLAGDISYALVRDNAAGKVTKLTNGDTLAGWKVDSIKTDSVLFSSGAQKTTLTMIRGGTAGTPATPVPPTPPAAPAATPPPPVNAAQNAPPPPAQSVVIPESREPHAGAPVQSSGSNSDNASSSLSPALQPASAPPPPNGNGNSNIGQLPNDSVTITRGAVMIKPVEREQ